MPVVENSPSAVTAFTVASAVFLSPFVEAATPVAEPSFDVALTSPAFTVALLSEPTSSCSYLVSGSCPDCEVESDFSTTELELTSMPVVFSFPSAVTSFTVASAFPLPCSPPAADTCAPIALPFSEVTSMFSFTVNFADASPAAPSADTLAPVWSFRAG